MLEGCVNPRDFIYGGGKEKGKDPFEIFRRLIRWSRSLERNGRKEALQFRARRSLPSVLCTRIRKAGLSLPPRRNLSAVIAGGKIIARPNKFYLLTCLSLSVPDTSVRVQRGIVSQYERGAAQESGTGGDLVDGAGKMKRLIDPRGENLIRFERGNPTGVSIGNKNCVCEFFDRFVFID